MEIEKKEVLRYLGYGGQEADPDTERLIKDCAKELIKAAEPRFLVREYPLTLGEDGLVDGTCFQTMSKNLAKNLSGCDRLLLMAATLGVDVDRLLARYGKYQVSRAVILQAAAASLIESFCNELCGTWKQEYEARGFYLRPRFSPGYGDFSIVCQEPVLNALEAGKRIGITLTEGFLMLPSKSVTAVIGAGRQPVHCEVQGCEVCEKTDCTFRRQME